MNALERQVQALRLRRALHDHRAAVDGVLAALDEGVVVPSDVLRLERSAMAVVVAGKPLWDGIDLNGPVTYEINPETKES
ncbi:hypothetical protein GCM10010399_63750 [Dactylosporangium fulvum]|uniref:Uncharacterized protein n=1 Tax=Dactylosporangium fulvum TaxID=53359 RepID=A0ABY5W7E2_9ACTN|nr:hypothetical protein [Dactylosporangium fulvum]UWP85802.1 hypothetical protein Dfulv_16780 [Dactylosporangium fulvum]